MFKLLENIDYFNDLGLGLEAFSRMQDSDSILTNTVSFVPVAFHMPSFNMTVNAPVTPTLWQESASLAGPKGDMLALSNGNILIASVGNSVGYVTDSFGGFINATTALPGDSILVGSVALSGGGFAILGADFDTNTLSIFTYSQTATLVSTQSLSLGSFSNIGQDLSMSINDAGTIFIVARLFNTDNFSRDQPIYGWTVDDMGTTTGPFLVTEDSSLLTGSNNENPFNEGIVSLDSGRFATVIFDNDTFGLNLRRTIDVEVTNPDGSSHLSINLTSASDGSIRAVHDVAHMGGGSLAVLYSESSNSGGDGLMHIAFVNADTGVLGSNLIVPMGTATSGDVQQLTALENSAGSPTGEYLVSILDRATNTLHIQRYDMGVTPVGSEILIQNLTNSFLRSEFVYYIEPISVSRFALIYTDASGDEQYEVYSYASEGNVDEAGNYIGTAGDDTLTNTNVATTGNFYLSTGNDTVTQTTAINLIDLGAGNDALIFNTAPTNLSGRVDGGSGIDSFSYMSTLPNISVTLDMRSDGILRIQDLGIETGGAATLIDFENITSGDGDDDIRGSEDANIFTGNGGDDFLVGYGGDDVLSGGSGIDTLVGGLGSDLLLGGANDDIIVGGSQNDNLQGFTGNDTFYQWDHGGTASGFTDTIDGGDGIDTLRMQLFGIRVGDVDQGDYDFNFAAGIITGNGETINISNVEILYAGDGDSTYTGTGAVNTVYGQGGDDVIFGFGGDDILDGGDGDDVISGGTGADQIDGGDGNDTGDYTYTNGNLTVNLDTGQAFGTSAGFGGETLTSIENLILGGGDDNITGNDDNNRIDGGNGDDVIFAGDGDDVLIGGGGDDVLDGGNGNDTADYSYTSANLTIDLANGEAFPSSIGNSVGDSLFSIENANGGGGDDLILDRSDNNIVFGDAGDDRFNYIGGNDRFDGGDGQDTLDLSASSGVDIRVDSSFISGADYVVTSQGGGFPLVQGLEVETFIGSLLSNNTFRVSGVNFANFTGGDENDIAHLSATGSFFDGRAGSDRLSYNLSGLADGVTIDAVEGIAFSNITGQSSATDDSFMNVERISGSFGNDTIYVSADLTEASGASGDDTLIFLSASDAVAGQFISGGLEGTDRLAIDIADGDEIDFRDVNLVSFQEFQFATSAQGGEAGAVFTANQFGDVGKLANDLHIIGSSPQNPNANDLFTIFLGVVDNFSLSQFTFTDWNNANNEINVIGNGDNETIVGSTQNDSILGNGGNDEILGSSGVDTLSGGSGDDIFRYFNEDDAATGEIVNGGADVDMLSVNIAEGSEIDLRGLIIESIEILEFGANAVSSNGTENIIIIDAAQIGGTGFSETLEIKGSQYGASAVDILDITLGNAGFLDLSGFGFTNWGAQNQEINVAGSAGDETIIGSSQDDIISGGDGDDLIVGGAGDDILRGGDGSDTLSFETYDNGNGKGVTVGLNSTFTNNAASGRDEISGFENIIGSAFDDRLFGNRQNNTIDGGGGNDLIAIGGGTNTIIGGEGSDRLDVDATVDHIEGDLATGTITLFDDFDNIIGTASLDSVENLRGGAGDDVLIAGGETNRLFGMGGNDIITGSDGGDFLAGGSGDDIISGGLARDFIFGGLGDDQIFGGEGSDVLRGNEGEDTIDGGGGNDSIVSGDENDTVDGGAGNDLILAGQGDDILFGGGDVDDIRGGRGHDEINGGAGNDRLQGNEGNDIFIFEAGTGRDRIVDFNKNGDDAIDLTDFGFVEFSDVADAIRSSGNHVIIDLKNGDEIVLLNTDIADIDDGDFIL